MTILRNNIEAFANGGSINTSTPSPSSFTLAEVAGSGTLTARTTAAIGGSRGLEAAGPSGSLARCGWAVDADAFNTVAGSVRLKGRAAPSADQRILNIFRTGGSTSCPYFIHRTSGNIELWNAAHALVAGWTATAFPTSAIDIVELRLWAEKGTTTTDGKIKGAMYVNGTLVEDVDNAACNAGVATFCGVAYGRATASTNTTTWILDDVAFEASGTGLIEAVPSGTPALVSAVTSATSVGPISPEVSGASVISGGGPLDIAVTAHAPTIRAPRFVTAARAFLGAAAYPPVITAVTSPPAPTVTATVSVEAFAPAIAVHSHVYVLRVDADVTAIEPTVSAAVLASVLGSAAVVDVEATHPQITASVAEHVFAPPSQLWRAGVKHPLFRRMSWATGISLVKEAGLYRQVETPTAEEITAADITYLGGHVYPIDETEVDDLTAAGYGAFVENRMAVRTYA